MPLNNKQVTNQFLKHCIVQHMQAVSCRIIIAVTPITEAGIYWELPPLILPAANHSLCNDVPVGTQWDVP